MNSPALKGRARRTVSPSVPPSERVYVVPTDHDILRGRGGRTNSHPGNQRLLELVRPLEAKYAALKRGQKGQMSLGIVDTVDRLWGGRFLEKETDSRGRDLFYIMSPEQAARLVEQKFRDEPNKRKTKMSKRFKTAKIKVKKSRDAHDDDAKTTVKKIRDAYDDDDESTVIGRKPLDFEEYKSWNIPGPSAKPAQSDPNKAALVHCVSPAHSLEDTDIELPSEDELEFDDFDLAEDETTHLASDPYTWAKEFSEGLVADPSLCFSDDQLIDLFLDGNDLLDITS